MPANPIIDVHALGKTFGKKPAVIDISLQINQGEIFGFLGPNGSGKTTTIRMLCGLLTPDRGYGHCLGYDIITQSDAIKRQVGYMTQRFSLYEELSIIENLDFIARVYQIPKRKARIQEILDLFNLTERRQQLAQDLSGGYKQRLALAGALLPQPKLLLLDEPTAGVDPRARREFWDHIHQLAQQGITTLVSTHYMDEAIRCHRLAYVAYGKLLIQGTVQSIIQRLGLITYEISGNNVAALIPQLQKLPAIKQVTLTSQSLQVTSCDEIAMLDALIHYPNYTYQRVETSLETAFIYLGNSIVDTRYV